MALIKLCNYSVNRSFSTALLTITSLRIVFTTSRYGSAGWREAWKMHGQVRQLAAQEQLLPRDVSAHPANDCGQRSKPSWTVYRALDIPFRKFFEQPLHLSYCAYFTSSLVIILLLADRLSTTKRVTLMGLLACHYTTLHCMKSDGQNSIIRVCMCSLKYQRALINAILADWVLVDWQSTARSGMYNFFSTRIILAHVSHIYNSVFKADFYIRVFVRVHEGKRGAALSSMSRMMVHQSTRCPSFHIQPMGT